MESCCKAGCASPNSLTQQPFLLFLTRLTLSPLPARVNTGIESLEWSSLEDNTEEQVTYQQSFRILIGIGIVGVLAQAGWATLNFSSLPVWITFHLKQAAQLGIAIATFMVCEAMFRPVFGSLSDRLGRKPVLLAGITTSIGISIAIIFMPTVWLIIPLMAVEGLGLAAYWPASFALIADSVSDEHRSTAMSILNGSAMVGVAIGWFLGGLTNDLTHSLYGSFYFVAAMFLLAAVIGQLLFPSLHPREKIAPDYQLRRFYNIDWMKVILPFRIVPDMLVINLIVFVAIGLLMPIMKLYAMRQYGLSETIFGAIVGPAAIILGIVSVAAGRQSDKWGHLPSVMYGLLLTALGMWIVPTFHNLVTATAGAIVVGIGFVLAYPSWMAIASDAAPTEYRGRIIGAVGMAEGVGAIAGVIIGPFIYSASGFSFLGISHYDLPFYMTALLLSVATILGFTWVKRRRSRRREEFQRRT